MIRSTKLKSFVYLLVIPSPIARAVVFLVLTWIPGSLVVQITTNFAGLLDLLLNCLLHINNDLHLYALIVI